MTNCLPCWHSILSTYQQWWGLKFDRDLSFILGFINLVSYWVLVSRTWLSMCEVWCDVLSSAGYWHCYVLFQPFYRKGENMGNEGIKSMMCLMICQISMLFLSNRITQGSASSGKTMWQFVISNMQNAIKILLGGMAFTYQGQKIALAHQITGNWAGNKPE